MNISTITVDWATALPVLVAAVGPTVTGFLQQYSKEFVAKAPWYAKSMISTGISALIGMILAYSQQGDALLAMTGGAVLGAIGSLNIALRKGTRNNLDLDLITKCPEPPK
jgi:hypothetical protein